MVVLLTRHRLSEARDDVVRLVRTMRNYTPLTLTRLSA
jgi:hypothetical protein